ncbi:MAG: hypothetical protein E6Q41_05045 [Cyclobacteriaceae bacterium]|nr:MAG: hypothetical protein E6Q41_05045 [Cyclobacteriaceae bacterium]
MKHLLLVALFLSSALTAFAQTGKSIDLHKAVKSKSLRVYNRELDLVSEHGYPGIRLSKDYGEGIAWINNLEFSSGTIEFDVRGEDVKQHSFVGIAFHGVNDSTFDAIYLRPFHFREKDETLRSHGIQYISLPEFTWRYLRAKFPDQYEKAVNPAPDPNAWVHVRLEITGNIISAFINGNSQPSLVVEKLTGIKTGSVGFYVADTSGGDFANLVITKSN